MISTGEWVLISVLHQQGYSMRQVARELRVSRNTVKRHLASGKDGPRYFLRGAIESRLDAYKDYILDGCGRPARKPCVQRY
ncbi:MAG: helix-turn-helix domain-containing protein [Pseudomonadota bacterium]|nr:helix-turn-helix domain-containing protein [Pseudomonadota bacterium]